MSLEQIKEIQEHLRTQDNFSTSWPLYTVRSKKKIYGMDGDYAGGDHVWIDIYADYSEVTDKKIVETLDKLDEELAHDDHYEQILDSNEQPCDIALKNFQKTWYIVTEQVEHTFVTEAAAKAYIKNNSHRHRDQLFMYVASAYRNFEMQAILSFLKDVDLEKLK